MKKNVLIVLLTITCLVLGGGAFYVYQQNKVDKIEEAQVILEQIEEVSKIIVVEGQFSEIYTYTQRESLLFDMMPVEKKIIAIINANASIVYDLENLDYEIDYENKKVILGEIPPPEIKIEPEIKYYDIQESHFYQLDENDYNRVNKRAIEIIESNVKSSPLISQGEQRLHEVLEQIIFKSSTMGWEVVKN
ncbi:MAG: DUF4230 domain-containing protein [Chitinophagales bacterium]